MSQMRPTTKLFLTISSLVNAAICYLSFWFMVFATSPHMSDVTMRTGYYVVNLITASAFAAIFAPWLLARWKRNKSAAFVAVLPILLICFSIVAFVTLDSWLSRTFSGPGAAAPVAEPAGTA